MSARAHSQALATFDLITLKFPDRSLEHEFEHDYFEKSVWHIRMAIGLAIALYSVFGYLDSWIVPEIKGSVWVIRYAIVDPVFIVALASTFSRHFKAAMQPVLAGVYLVASLGIIAMIVMAQPPGSHLYYAGLLLCVTFGSTLLRLHFVHAVWASVVIGIAYEISAIWLANTPLPILINNSLFFLSSTILGLLAGYNVETYIRREFLQRRLAKQSVEELKVLAEIGRAVSSTLDLETVLTTIVSRVDQLSGIDGGAIYEYDERTERLQLRATRGLQEALVTKLRTNPIALGEGAVRRAAARRQIAQIADVGADSELEACLRDLMMPYRFHAILAIPLRGEHRIFGGLVVVRKSPGAFPQTTIDLVTACATQTALAIQSARFFREIELKSQQLTEALEQQTATSEILRVISRSPTDIQPVLDAVAASAARLCAADDAVIRRLLGDVLGQVAHHGRIPVRPGLTVPVTRGTVNGRSVLDRRPIQVPDLQAATEEFPEGSTNAREHGFRTILSVPLLREGNAIGNIQLRRIEVQPFSDTQVALLQIFADQAVIAIENSRLFAELQTRNRELEEANRYKSEFLASMSHELRTPLNAIIGFSEILLDRSLKVSEEERKQFLGDVFNSGKHLLKLINEVLDLARIEAGRMELQLEPAILGEILDAVQSTMRPLAERKKIELRVARDRSTPAFLMDAGRVTQVLLNLVSNAIKFTPEAGRVWVRADIANEMARIEVGDTGVGIPAEAHERIFQEFEQVATGWSGDKPEGTGLGLALARKFVGMHGGNLWVESEVGLGSRFFFTLPMARRD